MAKGEMKYAGERNMTANESHSLRMAEEQKLKKMVEARDFPRLDPAGHSSVDEAAQAEVRIVRKRIKSMLEGRSYIADPLMNLRLHLALTLEAIDDQWRDGAPEAGLCLLRQYAEDCARLLSAIGASTLPAPPYPPPPPGPAVQEWGPKLGQRPVPAGECGIDRAFGEAAPLRDAYDRAKAQAAQAGHPDPHGAALVVLLEAEARGST